MISSRDRPFARLGRDVMLTLSWHPEPEQETYPLTGLALGYAKEHALDDQQRIDPAIHEDEEQCVCRLGSAPFCPPPRARTRSGAVTRGWITC